MNALVNSFSRPTVRSFQPEWGGKAASLLALQAAGFRVPEFVVSPVDIAAAVKRLGTPLVVRSSAVGEDGTESSFAGQFRSFLNLNSVREVERAVQLCHASLFEPSVLEYCRKHGVDPDSLRMHVIIQRMIEPELAGVAFTVNPVTGDEEVVIEACEGLADGLLAGRVQALPANHRLMETHREEIEATARRIQRHFGAPQDIEFALASGSLSILQSRPVTRIGFSADVGEWTNADFRDGGVSSTVCTPLMGSLYAFIWDRALKGSLRELKLFKHDFQAIRMFFGRPYWNLGAVKDCLAELPGFVEREFDEDLSVERNYEDDGRVTPVTLRGFLRAIPTLLAVRGYLRRQQAAAEALLDEGIESQLGRYSAAASEPETRFRDLIETDYLRIESTYFRTIFAASLAKLDFLSSFPEADYGSLVAALPPLRHVAPVREVQSMRQRTTAQLSDVIDNYRHHCRIGLDVIHPRWDEDRDFVTRMLAELPQSGGNNPQPAFAEACAAMLCAVPRWKHSRFHRKLNRLRHLLWLREELRDVSSRVYHLIRRITIEVADRRGLGDSIFFQTFGEIFADDRSGIERSREIYDSYRHFRAPNEIGSKFSFDRLAVNGAMRGIPASPGTRSATAFVANSVEEAARMPSGQILVCRYTDPGWTPVLDRVSGVVTETGGLLSHAAIICREYGVPAVLGVKDATRRIPSGAEIVIRGGEGSVELESEL